MKKTFMFMILALLLVSAVSAVPACNENQGSIWTTRNDCGTEQQDVNQYNIGEKVYIDGKNFCSSSYNWTITGQPGGASQDPGIIVASGSKAVDSSGSFCFEAYTIQSDDGGVYSVDFGKKNDNYHVNAIPLIPEFKFIIGVLTLLSGVGIFFFVRGK